MVVIRDKEQLVANGETDSNRRARALAFKGLEAALEAADPKQIIKSKLTLKDSTLVVDKYSFDLRDFRHVYVVGGGKAGGSMAVGLEHVLGSRVTKGIVNVPRGDKNRTKTVLLHESSHPTPDETGVEGTRRMVEMVEQAEKEDLVICLISGGGSSLMPLPRGKIAINDKRQITDALLKCGATINEINTVRKHISDFKGGWLAKKAYPATILNLILSDVVGDPLDFIASGPTVPDSTTFTDAINVLKKYTIWNKAPGTIREVLSSGQEGKIPDTPKADDEAFKMVFNVVVGNSRLASLAARNSLKAEGLNAVLLTATMEGEARHAGALLASIGCEVAISGNPVLKPAGVVAGGETTVTVTGKGLGSRNQEIALAASLKLKGSKGVAIASMSTDGIDGPTDAAGAVADGETITRAVKQGLKPEEFLADNDSYHFFERLDDLIFTGPTGTNVNDITVIVAI